MFSGEGPLIGAAEQEQCFGEVDRSGVDGALLVITPAGFERYFNQISARITGSEPPPEASKPIPEVITLGPPPEDRQ